MTSKELNKIKQASGYRIKQYIIDVLLSGFNINVIIGTYYPHMCWKILKLQCVM